MADSPARPSLSRRLQQGAGLLFILTASMGMADCGQGQSAGTPTLSAALVQQAYLKASNTGTGDLFGYSVARSGDTLVVGAYTEASNATGINGTEADNSASSSGAAYVFQ